MKLTTKNQKRAIQLMRKMVKAKVRRRFNLDDYNQHYINDHGLNILKREITYARKEYDVTICHIKKEWVVSHWESGFTYLD